MRSTALATFRGLAALGLLVGGAQAVAACNAVMGIEPAELDTTVGAIVECNWPQLDPSLDCFSGACEGAASTCPVDDCLKDEACRRKMRDYRKCAGNSCEDKAKRCNSCVSDNKLATAVVQCLDNKNCGATNSFTLCEAYCACMGQKCPMDQPGGVTGCKKACAEGSLGLPAPFDKKLEDWQTYCFWDHCERVELDGINDGFHCHHAVGNSANCQMPPVEDLNAPTCEYPKGYGNAPCDDDAQCCATCDEDRGVCESPI